MKSTDTCTAASKGGTDTSAPSPLPTCVASYPLRPNTLSMPAIGLGTFQVKEEAGYEAVKEAIKRGYRHIDTASVYRNEEAVGRAIRESGVPRAELFVTTKLAPHDHGKDKAYAALCRSLDQLGLDYVDLFLIHWPSVGGLQPEDPMNQVGRHASYVELQKGVAEGKIKNLGVSNFEEHHMRPFLSDPDITIPPAVNQVECHPYFSQTSLREFCKDHNILLQAYSSLGQGCKMSKIRKTTMMADQVVKNIAHKRGMTPAQVLLRWALQQGIPVLPKTTRPERMSENLAVLHLNLEAEDMQLLNALDTTCHFKFAWDPFHIYSTDPGWPGVKERKPSRKKKGAAAAAAAAAAAEQEAKANNPKSGTINK